MIGVNAQIETGGASQGNVGVGFAVPSNTVKTVAGQLIENGKVEHAAIGILAQELTPDVAEEFRLPVKSGVVVEEVQPGSGAAKAGLKGGTTDVTVAGESYRLGGDIIVAANGMPVERPRRACATSSPSSSPATRSRSRSTAVRSRRRST